ncbi:MAG TPA: hypothetical protein PL033_10825 [Candidatus Brocadiia bacterium]|nr:hypothetical protein [Candidatus Brocadiia bacterium]
MPFPRERIGAWNAITRVSAGGAMTVGAERARFPVRDAMFRGGMNLPDSDEAGAALFLICYTYVYYLSRDICPAMQPAGRSRGCVSPEGDENLHGLDARATSAAGTFGAATGMFVAARVSRRRERQAGEMPALHSIPSVIRCAHRQFFIDFAAAGCEKVP